MLLETLVNLLGVAKMHGRGKLTFLVEDGLE
jgi:hypothetical protein